MSFASQARREVAAAYKPAFKVANRAQRRVQNQARKQARDDNAYQNWLRDTNASLNSEATARDAQLQGVQAGYDQQLRDAMGGAQQQASARGLQLGGAVPGAAGAPNPANADPIVQGIATLGSAQAAAHGSRLAGQQRLGLDLSMATEKNSYATLALVRAKHRSEVLDALSKIADQRGDLAMKRAADVGKRTADLEAAAAKEAQQRITNNLALARLAQGDARIAQGDQRLKIDANATGERLRQGRVRNQLSRRRLAQSGADAKSGKLSPAEARARAKQIASAEDAVSKAYNVLTTDKSALKHYGSGRDWKLLVRHLVNNGVPESVAIVAVAKYHGHGTASVPDAWKRAIATQTG